MKKIDFWDIIFWLGMIILVLYIIAKLTGLINTPEWISLLPLISLAFIIGAFYQKVMNFMELIHKRTDYLKNNLDRLNQEVFRNKSL